MHHLIDKSSLKRAGVVKIDSADLNTTLRRGWCFGSQEFKEKLDVLLGKKISEGNTYRVENGYDGQQLRGMMRGPRNNTSRRVLACWVLKEVKKEVNYLCYLKWM